MLWPQCAADSEYRSGLVHGPDSTLVHGDSLTAAFLPGVPGHTAWAHFRTEDGLAFLRWGQGTLVFLGLVCSISGITRSFRFYTTTHIAPKQESPLRGTPDSGVSALRQELTGVWMLTFSSSLHRAVKLPL